MSARIAPVCVVFLLAALLLAPRLSRATIAVVPASDYLVISLDFPSLAGVFGLTSLDDVGEAGALVGDFGLGSILGAPQPITCLDPALSTEPKSINGAGVLAGFCGTTGFVRDAQGVVTLLSLPGAQLTEAIGLNDATQVVGDFRDAQGHFHAFFWQAGLFLPFDVPFAGATGTGANGINNVGQIIGTYFDDQREALFPNGHMHGFLLSGGAFTGLDVPGALATLPMDLNDAGQIVGLWVDATMGLHSFLYEEGVFREVAVPFPEALVTDIEGINQQGLLVGSYLVPNPADPTQPPFRHGLLLTPVSAMAAPIGPLRRTQRPAEPEVPERSVQQAPRHRLHLDGCQGAEAPSGALIPAKMTRRHLFCRGEQGAGMAPKGR
jgi:hypothetical protein